MRSTENREVRYRMRGKIRCWCYGGETPATFKEYETEIHKYNSKMMRSLLWVMTILMACYVVGGSIFKPLSQYSAMHWIYFSTMLIMLIVFCWKGYRHIATTNAFIALFAVLTFVFVCALGTIFEQDMMAVMIIVYTLALPMIFIVPTHYMFCFLSIEILFFCVCSLVMKEITLASLDIVNAITCLVIGLFVSQRILESRISLLVANKKLDYLSKIDALTGIPNRHSLEQYIHRIYATCEHLTLAILDLDNFKEFNDTHGHYEGDRALKLIAEIMKEYSHTTDFFVARFGGEEFVILDMTSDSNRIKTVLEEIRETLQERTLSGYAVTASIGYAEKIKGESYEALFKRADDALYRAKEGRKNCVVKSN